MHWRVSSWVTALSLLATPALADWHRIEGTRFVVISDDTERNSRSAIRELERFDLVLRQYFNLPTDETTRKLPIYLVSPGDLEALYPGDTNISGFYASTSEDIFGAARRRGDLGVLKHEYTHHFLASEWKGARPAWFNEGFAQYFSTAQFEGDKVHIGKPPAWSSQSLLASGWMPLDTLLTERPIQSDGTVPRTYYPLSWLLTHWFLKDEANKAKLERYLAAVTAGTPSVQAMENSTGLSLDELRRTLSVYAGSSLGYRTTTLNLEPQLSALTALPEAADELLIPLQRLKLGVTAAERTAFLSRFRTLAARYPEDSYSLYALAYAEFRLADDNGRAEALLQQLLTKDPHHAEGQLLLGRIAMAQAERSNNTSQTTEYRAKAQSYFAAAYATDPNNPFTLSNLGRNRRFAPSYPSQSDLDVLIAAYEIAPQHPYTALNLAEALIKLGRWDEARGLLLPLVNNPHRANPQAQALLDQINTRP